MKVRRLARFLPLLLLAVASLGLAAACSTDSPSEPQQTPAPTPPGSPAPTGDFSITVGANPPTLEAGTTDPTLLTVQVRRRDNGQVPSNGTTVTVSTNLGDLGSLASGIRSTVLTLINGSASVELYPSPTSGRATIQARLGSDVGQATVDIGDGATFFIAAVAPATGSPNGGDTVQIQGGGFEEPVRVLFGGVAAQVVSVNSGLIRAVVPRSTVNVPSGSTRSVPVQVTVRLNTTEQQSDQLQSGYTYVPGGGSINQPQVFSLTPASGANEGGTTVTIRGDGFESPVQVLFGQGNSGNAFNGVEAVVQSVSQNQIVVTTPAATGFGQGNQNSTVNVLVRNLTSGFETVSLAAFRYGSEVIITDFQPRQTNFDENGRITIFGQGFDEPVAITIAGLPGTPLSVTGTEIVFRAPQPAISGCQSVSGPIQVVNVETGESDGTNESPGPTLVDFLFRVLPPTITGLTPTSGAQGGGGAATISGVGFEDPVRVTFGDSAANVTSTTGSAIGVTIPAFTGTFQEVACDDDGDGQQGMRFVPSSVDVSVTNLITECTDTFTAAFTYIPADQTCRGDQAPVLVQCNDGFDNDGDGFIDAADPECTGPNDNDESS